MESDFQFKLVEIMPPDDFLRLSPEQRLAENDRMANRLFALENLMKRLIRGWTFIQSQHGNPR